MPKRENVFKVEGNMFGMAGVAGWRLGVFCHHPQSFVDVAYCRELVATWASDMGAMNLYRDDEGHLRGSLCQRGFDVYTFAANGETYYCSDVVSQWAEAAIEWCKEGGTPPRIEDIQPKEDDDEVQV